MKIEIFTKRKISASSS